MNEQPSTPTRSGGWRSYAWLLPTVALAGLWLYSTTQYRPTPVKIRLETAAFAMTVGGTETLPLVNTTASFTEFTVQGCVEAVLRPDRLRAASSDEDAPEWREVPSAEVVRLTCNDDPNARVTLSQAEGDRGILGMLPPIPMKPGARAAFEIDPLETEGEMESLLAEIRIDLEEAYRLELPIHGELVVRPEGARITEGARASFADPLPDLQIEAAGPVEIASRERPTLRVTPAGGASTNTFFAGRPTVLAGLEVLAPPSSETWMTYTDFPDAENRALDSEEIEALSRAGDLVLNHVYAVPAEGIFDLRIVGELKSEARREDGTPLGVRMTVDRWVRMRWWWIQLVGVLLWAGLTGLLFQLRRPMGA